MAGLVAESRADEEKRAAREREAAELLERAGNAEKESDSALERATSQRAEQESAQADTRSFYWLGFTPSRERNDSHREIEVEVRHRGMKVRTRGGYSDLAKETEVAMAVESALLFGLPASSGSLRMEFGAPRRAGRGKIELPVTVHIPIDEISLLQVAEGTYEAQLAIRIAVLDEQGQQSEIPNIALQVRREELPAPGETIAYETTLRLRRKPHDLLIAVYDEASGELLSATAEIGP